MKIAVLDSCSLHDREKKLLEQFLIPVTGIIFLLILALAAWLRFQGITEKGIFAYDSTDVWRRACERLDGIRVTGAARYQPIPDYLNMLAMALLGKKDFAPLVVNALFDIANTALLFFLSLKLLRSHLAALACMGLYAVMLGSISLSREAMSHPVAVLFIMLTFWAFIRYSEETDCGRGGPACLWLAGSGCLAGITLASHVSTQFLCVAYIVLIAMKVFSLDNLPFLKRISRLVLHAAIFTTGVFALTGIIFATEMALRSPRVFLAEINALSRVRTDPNSMHVFETHYWPRVAASKMRPTMTSATLDHLILGPERLANGARARDRMDTLWYGDNAYSVMFLLNIPLMIHLAGRIRKKGFPGYAFYVLSFFYALGLYATYTAFYAHHSRYIIHLMPFLTINLFFWPLLWAREFLPGRGEFVVAFAVALAALSCQRIVLPGDTDILEPTAARVVADAVGECGVDPYHRILVTHPEFSWGGTWEPTLQTVYNRCDAIRRFPRPESLKHPYDYFSAEHIRYLFTDETGIEGLLDRKEIRDDPAVEQKLRELFAHAAPVRHATISRKEIKGIIYEINLDVR